MPKVPIPKLYNHSERASVSHQISSSSGSTSTGRCHATYDTSSIHVSHAPDPDDDDIDGMDVAFPLQDHDQAINNPEPSSELQTEIEELPGLKVRAKPRAKRYENSVIPLLSVSCFINPNYRINLSKLG